MNFRLGRAHAGDEVYERLRGAIERGELAEGQLLAGTRALQQELGVSYYAVLRGTERLAREGWISRRPGAGTFVRDARPNQQLAGAARKRVALLLPDAPPQRAAFLAPLVDAVRETLGQFDAQLFDAPLPHADTRITLRDHFPPDPPDVAIWVAPSISHFEEFDAPCPFVLLTVDSSLLLLCRRGHDIVSVDSLQGGTVAGRHLRRAGCRRALFLGARGGNGDPWAPISAERLRGLEAGWGEALPAKDCFALPDFMLTSGLAVAARVLRQGPQPLGIFAAADDLAMGVAHGAATLGLRLGDDIRLIGFDGQPARFGGDPALTSVAPPLADMGRAAARWALERAEQPDLPSRRLQFECVLKRGDTA